VVPEALVDCRAFLPLQEMAHGFIWCLTCDSILATGTVEAQKHLQTFLSRGETVIRVSSYFGDNIPGCLCPNFAYHFTVIASWPMHINPLVDLAKLMDVLVRLYYIRQCVCLDFYLLLLHVGFGENVLVGCVHQVMILCSQPMLGRRQDHLSSRWYYGFHKGHCPGG
jgi:hypothetical protein